MIFPQNLIHTFTVSVEQGELELRKKKIIKYKFLNIRN